MSDPYALDKRLARRAFERAAATYDAAAVLQNEVCRRMLARLDYIKLDPPLVLDAGSGTGNAIPGLLARWPRARVIALDLALAMARRSRARRPWWRRALAGDGRLAAVCGDIERLPLASACFRVFLANNNTPLSPNELHQLLPWKPADAILRTLAGTTVYLGLRPVN